MVYKNGSIFLWSYKTCCLLILFSKTNTNDFVSPAIHQAIGGSERERMKKKEKIKSYEMLFIHPGLHLLALNHNFILLCFFSLTLSLTFFFSSTRWSVNCEQKKILICFSEQVFQKKMWRFCGLIGCWLWNIWQFLKFWLK